jgi:hypothetical protein
MGAVMALLTLHRLDANRTEIAVPAASIHHLAAGPVEGTLLSFDVAETQVIAVVERLAEVREMWERELAATVDQYRKDQGITNG